MLTQMKQKNKILLIISLVVVFGSCDNWLYTEPENGIILDDFWKTKEDVHAAMMGCYASLLGNTRGGGNDFPYQSFMWGEMRADWVIPGRSISFDYYNIFIGEIYPENRFTKWNAFYRTINYCNTLIHFAPQALEHDPSFTQEMLNEYTSEALALRALMYFYLTRTFSDVPLILEATTNDGQDFYLPKSTQSEVLKSIKSDLTTAEKHAVYTYGDLESDKSRITKYSINAILSDVYLWCEQYDSTIIACNKIINSGVFGLVEGDENWFENLYVNGNSAESIFELPFSITKQNPYYSLFSINQNYRASGIAAEEFFPFDADAPLDSFDLRGDGCSYKGSNNMMIWKHVGVNRDDRRASNESYANIILYRYAEILLNKAEALNQVGKGEEALQLVQMVRKRANASKVSRQSGTDRILLGEYILNERAREFAFEGKRWFDILRNAKRNNYERLDLLLEMASRNAPAERQVTILNKFRDTLSHYLPIYQGEIENNHNLIQNPYYEN
jgi:hypothetical protein